MHAKSLINQSKGHFESLKNKRGVKMKAKNPIVLLFLLIIPITTEAKFSKYVGVGLTRATLRTEGGKSEWGKFFGLGLEYTAPFSLLLAVEASYATKKVTLENKSWPSDSEIRVSNKSIGNIPIHNSYYELATKIGYSIPAYRNLFFLKIYAGPVISMPFRYLNSFRPITHVWYEDEGPFEFDYLRDESETLPDILIDYIIGGTVSYKAIGIELRYARSSTERKCMRGLTINDKLDSFYAVLRYSF